MALPLALLLILLIAAAWWLFPRLRRVAAIGAAYKAKVLCSVVFGSGRAVDPDSLEEVSADSYRLMRLFRWRVDRPGAQCHGVARGVSSPDRRLQGGRRRDGRAIRMADGARVFRPRSGRRRGVSRARSQTPAPHARDSGRAGRTDCRRALRPGLRRNDAVFRMVDDEERARRPDRRAGRRRPPLPPGRRADAGLAPSGSPRRDRARRPVADAERAGVFRGLRGPDVGCDRNAVQPGRCRRLRREPTVDRPTGHGVELLERHDQHPVGHRPPQCR